MIYNFSEFLLEKMNNYKVAIFLLGAPASGKSTFMKNFISPSMRSFKLFDSDEFMKDLLKIGKQPLERSPEQRDKKLLKMKDAVKKLKDKYDIDITLSDEELYDIMDNNLYVPDVTEKLDNKITKYIETSSSDFIYDSTGNSKERVKKFIDLAKEYDYKVILISMKTDIKDSVIGNLNRSRKVQIDYHIDAIEKSEELGDFYKNLVPEDYYEYNAKERKLTKFEDGEMENIRPSLLRNKIGN